MRNRLAKIGALLIGGLLCWSCTMDDGMSERSFSYELNPVTEVEVPDTVFLGDKFDIQVKYQNPSDCYTFDGFDFTMGDTPNERIISVVSIAYDDISCKALSTPKIESRALQFEAMRSDFYKLRFWQGTDSLDQPVYLTKKVVVEE